MWFIKKIPKKQTITFSKLRFILLAQELHCYTNVLQKKNRSFAFSQQDRYERAFLRRASDARIFHGKITNLIIFVSIIVLVWLDALFSVST